MQEDLFNTPKQQFKPGQYVRIRPKVLARWKLLDKSEPRFKTVSIIDTNMSGYDVWKLEGSEKISRLQTSEQWLELASEQWLELDSDHLPSVSLAPIVGRKFRQTERA
jgi:hypothetical protein